MKSVPLKDLKLNLSSWVEQAHEGDTITVTKHNRPYVLLIPICESSVRRGQQVGKSDIQPLFRNKTRGAWLKVLNEDREDK